LGILSAHETSETREYVTAMNTTRVQAS